MLVMHSVMLSVVILTVIVLRVEAPFAIIRLTRKGSSGTNQGILEGEVSLYS
jgi:hypothetical protein